MEQNKKKQLMVNCWFGLVFISVFLVSTNGKLLVWGPVVWDPKGAVKLTIPFIIRGSFRNPKPPGPKPTINHTEKKESQKTYPKGLPTSQFNIHPAVLPLPETNSEFTPENRPGRKRKPTVVELVFQPFRCVCC